MTYAVDINIIDLNNRNVIVVPHSKLDKGKKWIDLVVNENKKKIFLPSSKQSAFPYGLAPTSLLTNTTSRSQLISSNPESTDATLNWVYKLEVNSSPDEQNQNSTSHSSFPSCYMVRRRYDVDIPWIGLRSLR